MSEFESRAEAKGRFKGSSLHFLQEEQFRKAATKQYRQYVAAVAAADPPTPPPMLLLLCAPSCCATSDTLALQARAAAHVGRARLGRGARRAIPCRWRAGSEPARARATGASVRATGSCVNMAWVTQPACPPARPQEDLDRLQLSLTTVGLGRAKRAVALSAAISIPISSGTLPPPPPVVPLAPHSRLRAAAAAPAIAARALLLPPPAPSVFAPLGDEFVREVLPDGSAVPRAGGTAEEGRVVDLVPVTPVRGGGVRAPPSVKASAATEFEVENAPPAPIVAASCPRPMGCALMVPATPGAVAATAGVSAAAVVACALSEPGTPAAVPVLAEAAGCCPGVSVPAHPVSIPTVPLSQRIKTASMRKKT